MIIEKIIMGITTVTIALCSWLASVGLLLWHLLRKKING